jgi:hypothetical protein
MDIVLIDESYSTIDYVLGRYTFAHVIIPEECISEFENWLKKNVDNDKLRFLLKGKLHFSELTTAQEDFLIEKICKMPLTCKLYITYFNTLSSDDYKNIKLDLLIRSIKHHQLNKPNSKYIVEKATSIKL